MGAIEEISKLPDNNGKTLGIITRPNASYGFWLCTLLPFAYMASNYRFPYSSLTIEYKTTTITSFGLLLQSINIIFILLTLEKRKFLKIFTSLFAGGFTTFLFWICLKQTPQVCFLWGYGSTLFYQYGYFKLLRLCPRSFTYGEAFIIAQGFTLFILNAFLQIPKNLQQSPDTDLTELTAIMLEAFFCLTIILLLILSNKLLRNTIIFYILMVILLISVCVVPVTSKLPIIVLIEFITEDAKRIFIIIFYIGIVGLTIATINWGLKQNDKVSTGIRKIFHIIVVLVFIPGYLYQCKFLYIASGIAFAILIILETFRLCNIPPIGEILNDSFNIFADEKDAGKLALTPFYLLIGCSIPMWITPCPCSIMDGNNEHLISMLAGVISVGIGDTTASCIGSKFGKHKFPKSSKTMEGTLASIILQFLTVLGFYYLDFVNFNEFQIGIITITIIIVSITEALTDQIDNLVLPLLFYILCFV